MLQNIQNTNLCLCNHTKPLHPLKIPHIQLNFSAYKSIHWITQSLAVWVKGDLLAGGRDATHTRAALSSSLVILLLVVNSTFLQHSFSKAFKQRGKNISHRPNPKRCIYSSACNQVHPNAPKPSLFDIHSGLRIMDNHRTDTHQ